jgi:hypothetical protein
MQEIQNQTDIQPKISKFWDTIDNIDRALYGRKMKNFLIGSLLVLAAAPILDWFLEVPHDRLTFYSTLFFLIYTLILILAWLSAWRDENGNWTLSYALKCGQARIITSYKIFKNTAATTKTTSINEILYNVGSYAIVIAVAWKSLQNLSVFIRKPIESLTHTRRMGLRNFELTTKHWTTAIFIIGLAILCYLYYSNPKILERIKKDLKQLFGRKTFSGGAYSDTIIIQQEHGLVINSRNESEMSMVTKNKSNLFSDFASAINSWNPKNCRLEYEYQNDLLIHLSTVLPKANIKTEYPIGYKELGNKGRADIIIDDTILIEMKRDSSASAVQRAKGQILQYSEIWKNRGPVILLLCNHEHKHAKLSYNSTMLDLHQLNRPALTIVAN